MIKPHPAEWTEDEVKTLRKLAAEGKSGRQIAAILKKSRGAVSGKSARLGVHLVGVPKISIRPVSWTAERIDEFTRRWEEGESEDSLAIAYQMTAKSVKTRAWKLGLKPRGRQPSSPKTPTPAPQEATPEVARTIVLPTTPPDVPGPYSGPSWALRGRYCHWPHGSAPRGHMDEVIKCGAPIDDGVYCDAHRAIAIRPDNHPRSQARR